MVLLAGVILEAQREGYYIDMALEKIAQIITVKDALIALGIMVGIATCGAVVILELAKRLVHCVSYFQ